MGNEDFFNLNIQVKNLPVETNRILDALCRLRGLKKHQLITEALVEYAKRHRTDFIALTRVENGEGSASKDS